MYVNNKYKYWYIRLMLKASKRREVFGYCERHHIKPKALGGNNSRNNVVVLTLKEHFLAHLVLSIRLKLQMLYEGRKSLNNMFLTILLLKNLELTINVLI